MMNFIAQSRWPAMSQQNGDNIEESVDTNSALLNYCGLTEHTFHPELYTHVRHLFLKGNLLSKLVRTYSQTVLYFKTNS